MTSTNDGKDVKSTQIAGLKAKTYFIELYKTLEARLSVECELGARTSLLCEAWRRVHCLCQHSASSTQSHLISWLQRHTAQTLLQSEWRQLSLHQDKHAALAAAIDCFILECQQGIITRRNCAPQWESELLQRAEWFKTVIRDPWGNAVLRALLDRTGEAPTDKQILEWLREERGVFFVARLRQLASSKKTVDIALSLATAVMERVRACAVTILDSDAPGKEEQVTTPTFTDLLTSEAGFTVDVWELITDIEFVLLYTDRSKCIALAKQTPLKTGYQLVERLHCRLDVSTREKRLWKNAKDVAILIAQVMIARCMVLPTCTGTARSTLYGCSRSLVKLLPPERLPGAMAALAAPAATARHLHTLALAVDAQCKNERKPFVCELYIRAITAGMNELERLKLTKEKETEARTAEKLLGSWFTALGTLLSASARLAYECALTAFSLHPSPAMYERIRTAPQLQPAPVHKDVQEPAAETNSEFGSWATDSRSQTNFVKTSETLNLKKIQQHSNVLSTAVLNEGEALGLSPELCQDLIVLLSGPRVKTLSWDMDKEVLIENCRSYMERTHGGTRALTTELKYLNLDPDSFMHLPQEEDEDEGDIYYGIEKGYEHLVELQEPEEIWEDALSDPVQESYYSTDNEALIPIPKGKKKGKIRRNSYSTEEEVFDPLGDTIPKPKQRSHSSESNYKPTKERRKERSKERKKKDGDSRDSSNSVSKSKAKKDREKIKNIDEGESVNKNINEGDSMAVDAVKSAEKPKKERKKREKKVKKDSQKQPTSSLSRLIGKKIIKSNMLNTHEQISKREMETDFNNQVFITDSDYDSQGKSSIASIHTEGNDPDVLFDGLFSMDDIKSPEKTSVIPPQKPNPLQLGKVLNNNAIKVAPGIKSHNLPYVQNYGEEVTRPSSTIPSMVRNINEIPKLPQRCSSNVRKNENIDEVKLGIKRLIEFRKQKSATELFNRTKQEFEAERQAGHKRSHSTIIKKNVNKYETGNRMENESRILPGTPKAISVPDIPKVFINKHQSQQLNSLKNEVDSYLLNRSNSVNLQTYPMNNMKKPEVRHNKQTIKTEKSGIYPTLSKFDQKLMNMLQQSEFNQINNIAHTPLLNQSSSNYKYNMAESNTSLPDQNRLQEFFKELHRANNAGVSNDIINVPGLTSNADSFNTTTVTNYSAKQIKPTKKVENVPNTFARRNYMHKNKQGDGVYKQNNDHLVQNKLHRPSHPETNIYSEKTDVFDTLLSRVDCTVRRTSENTSQTKGKSSKVYQASTGYVNVNHSAIKRAVSTDARLAMKSNPVHSQVTPTSMSTATHISRTSILRPTIPSSSDDAELRNLLRQKSKPVGPRSRSTVRKCEPPTKKEIGNMQLSTRQQIRNEIYNSFTGCPVKTQPGQNMIQIQNAVADQPKSSNVIKTKDITTKGNVRNKPTVNTKESYVSTKNEIVPQDWESVLNDLLSHKTPSRGSNAQVSVINKDNKQAPSTSLIDKRMNYLDTSKNYDVSNASRKRENSFATETALTQNKPTIPINSKPLLMGTSSASVINKVYSSNTTPVIHQPVIVKANDQIPLRKANQPLIIRRASKIPDVKLPQSSKLSDVKLPQNPTNPILSNMVSSEYDMLEELMDDDLRQELGELSSDEDNFTATTNVMPKGKVKILSNKSLGLVGNPNSFCNMNVRQNHCSNNQVSPILKPEVKVATGYETKSVIINKPIHNTMYIRNNSSPNCLTRTQRVKTCDVIHQTPKPNMPMNAQQLQGQGLLKNNDDIIDQSQFINPMTSNNCMPFEPNVQQSNLQYNNENVINENPRLITPVNQNIRNAVNVGSQKPPAIKNVVLIRPEIVYEPYSVQVHDIPETVNSDIQNKFLAVNNVPTISMFGTQFANPVINPVIIGKTITVPITQNTTSLVVNTGTVNKSAHINSQNHSSSIINNPGMEKTCGTESHFSSEKPTRIDNSVNHIQYVKINDQTTSNTEGILLAESSKKQNVTLPCAVKSVNAEQPTKSTLVACRHGNDFKNKIQITSNDAILNPLSEKLTKTDNAVPHLQSEAKINDYVYNSESEVLSKFQEKATSNICYISNANKINKTDMTSTKIVTASNSSHPLNGHSNITKHANVALLNSSNIDVEVNSAKKVLSSVQEKLNLTTTYNTSNKTNIILPEKISIKYEQRTDSFSPIKVENASKNTMSSNVKETCPMVDGAVTRYPETYEKINDCILNKMSDGTVLPKNQGDLPAKREENNLKTCNSQKGANNMNSEKTLTECRPHYMTCAPHKVESGLKNHSSGPCATVHETVSPCSKTDVKVSKCTLNENCNEKKVSTKLQDFSKNTSFIPSSANKPESLKPFDECRQNNNGPKQVQSVSINTNSISSTGQCKIVTDTINHNCKSGVIFNEISANNTSERKVLSEVQEKNCAISPDKTNLKSSIRSDEEIKKVCLKAREERLIKKKTAILNRKVHSFSDIEPIPLPYASINTSKTVPNKDEKLVTNVGSVYSTKIQTLTAFDDVAVSVENGILKDNMLDKINNSNDPLIQKDADNFKSVLTAGSKENKESNKTESIRVLRSSNKEVNNSAVLPQKDNLDYKSIRNKVKLKVQKVKDRSDRNDFKRIKRSRKKGEHKKQINRGVNISRTKGNNDLTSATPVSSQNLPDLEEQLQGPIICKKDSNKTSDQLHKKDPVDNCNLQRNITVDKEIYIQSKVPCAISDQNDKNVLTDKDPCHENTKTLPSQNSTPKETSNKDQEWKNTNKNNIDDIPRLIKTILPNDHVKFGANVGDENRISNVDNLKQKHICMNTKELQGSNENVSAQIKTHLNTGNNNDTLTTKSQHDIIDERNLINSYKDNITIEELPRQKGDDPLKRCILIKLANGNSFKATVSGKLNVDINSLFKDPAIRTVLKNSLQKTSKCFYFNIKEVVSASGENIRTCVVPTEPKTFETINLVSDDEEETVSQVFNTEFGKYKVQNLDDKSFKEHQKKLSQRCFVNVQKCDLSEIKSKKIFESENKSNVDVNKEVKQATVLKDIKSNEPGDTAKNNSLPIIEIDDSSNDSIDINISSMDVGIQPVSTFDDIDLNFKELKETLLKDLCVDVNNKTIDSKVPQLEASNVLQLDVPVDIPIDLEILKETLLKDLCNDLGNIEKESKVGKHLTTDIDNSPQDNSKVGSKTLSENLSSSTSYCVKSTNDVLTNENSCKSVCNTKQNTLVDSSNTASVFNIKSVKNVGIVEPMLNNKLSSPKRCQLKIGKCDDLVKKYQLIKNKRCFVPLERCDKFIKSQIEKKPKIIETENTDLNENGQANNIEMLFAAELDTSNSTLQRSGSFSILNEINLYGQSTELIKPIECNINVGIYDKCENHFGNIDKSNEQTYICQSDWFMTKLRFQFIVKQIQSSSIILNDDISTDCDSDHDDNYSHSESIFDDIEKVEVSLKHATFQVPSLLQSVLKFLEDNIKLKDTKLSKSQQSLHHLKRKSIIPENTLSDKKFMKFDDRDQHITPKQESLDIKITEKHEVKYSNNTLNNADELISAPIAETSINIKSYERNISHIQHVSSDYFTTIQEKPLSCNEETEVSAICGRLDPHKESPTLVTISETDHYENNILDSSVSTNNNRYIVENCDKKLVPEILDQAYLIQQKLKCISDCSVSADTVDELNKILKPSLTNQSIHSVNSKIGFALWKSNSHVESDSLCSKQQDTTEKNGNTIGTVELQQFGIKSDELYIGDDMHRAENNNKNENTKNNKSYIECLEDTKTDFYGEMLKSEPPSLRVANINEYRISLNETANAVNIDTKSIDLHANPISNYNNNEDISVTDSTIDYTPIAGNMNKDNVASDVISPSIAKTSKQSEHEIVDDNESIKIYDENSQGFKNKTTTSDTKPQELKPNLPKARQNQNYIQTLKNNNCSEMSESKNINQTNRLGTVTQNISRISDDIDHKPILTNMNLTVHDMNSIENSNMEILLRKDCVENSTDNYSNFEKSALITNNMGCEYDSKGNETKITADDKIVSYDPADVVSLTQHEETNIANSNLGGDIMKSNDCTIKTLINGDNTVTSTEKNSKIAHSFDKDNQKVLENYFSKNNMEDSVKSRIKTDVTKGNNVKIDETTCPKNITLLYESDSKVVLEGSIIEDPIVGTCYVFPIKPSDILVPLMNNNVDYTKQDKTMISDVCSNLFQDTELIVKKPNITYSKTDLKPNYFSKNLDINEKVSRKNLKRKKESVDSKINQKKYRKGKNIDFPKITLTAICNFAYSKEFKKLVNYCDSIKFSYSIQHHLIQLDDVHTMLKDWPIKESNIPVSNGNKYESDLFIDIEQKSTLSDPTVQTFAEEILAIYDEEQSTLPEINETNFSMGFGEGSGRVNQNLIDGKQNIEVSAVTLSDVKHSQPFLQSIDNDESYLHEIRHCREKEFKILDNFYSYIRLRDQVKSFFRKTTAELNSAVVENNFKSDKRKSSLNELFDSATNFPFDLNIPEFFEPPLVESIVQVVQVGQSPVSAGAQNPVTCDPRVTQVTDASPPQCSMDSEEHDDMQPTIKTEYTELTNADISLPLMSNYEQHHQELISESQSSNLPPCNDNITIETEVKIEVLEEVPENMDEQGRYDSKDFPKFPNDHITNADYPFDDINVPIKTEEPDVKIVFEPAERSVNTDVNQISQTYEIQQRQQNVSIQKPDQLAHAMSAAGISSTPEPIPDTAMDLSNSLARSVCAETDANNYQRSNITAMALQQALAQILPSSLNPTSESENTSQASVPSQILHLVHGKNTSLSQMNTQPSVISTAPPTPVLHIVQSKNGPTSSCNSSPVHNSKSYGGLSLVDTGLSQGGNQLLHIVNTGNQKPNNGAQLLKRVNLLTNLANVQGSNEQKMVQFVCKSTDAKGIQLNTHQRSMVLRLHTIESPQSVPSKPECQDPSPRESSAKDPIVPQELKSRSVYEENYAKFIQNSSKPPVIEKSTSLPKFNQAFGKPVFQEDNQKSNDIEANNTHLPPEDNNIENNGCPSTENSLHLENIRQIGSPPLLLRKPSNHIAAQQNLVQQIKQAITPMNIQTMHGGVIYTRQIPVNIGGGQTINLITVPTTERIDDPAQKQKNDVKFTNRSEIEPSIIKIVPQGPVTSNSDISAEENNNSGGVSNDTAPNSQPAPMLTQMRIKLPMLSKNPQMVSAARVVRPSFFQIQRNVIGGPNQPVYQQLVLTAAPTIGQQAIRLPHVQSGRDIKVGSESQTSPESQMSSSTLEQLREFDMVLEQVKERSTTVQPNATPAQDFSKPHILPETSESATRPSEGTQQVLYSIGNNQSVNVAYVNRKSTVVSTSATTLFTRSADSSSSSSIAESPTSSSHASSTHAPHTVTSEATNGTHSNQNHHKSTKVSSKPKPRPKSHHPQFKINSLPPKPSNQKPMEDEQTTQRILYILAEYKEQVENSPDKDKPAPRRRTNLQASITPPGGRKRKKSSSGSRRSGRDTSPLDDNCRTMGSEDSSCGTSQGDCSETCQELHSPQGSPRKVAKKLSFDQDCPVSQPRPQLQQTQSQPQPQQQQPQFHKQTPHPQLQRNVLVTDGPTIAVTRAAPGKPATAVLMPANYILPVSMVKSGQQIAIVTNRGPKILTVGGGEGGATNALLLQRLISPTGLKPMLARPGVRHVRLPTTALHNLQTFNLAAAATAHQPPEAARSPVPATSPPELIDSKAPRSPWTSRGSEEVKPEEHTSPERLEQEQEAEQEPEPEPEPEPDPDPEPWNVPHDYSYEETVRTEMDRTVLDAIPDRYSPDMEAQRIFDKMFDVESKKGYIDSQDDSPRCPYDIDASDCDDKAYHQVVQRRDGVANRHRLVSAASLRQKFALMEDELRLQKSLSEECEDLGVDSPSASDLFPEAELLFSSSPAHEVSHPSHTPQPVNLNQSNGIPKPDLDDQTATDQLISRKDSQDHRQTDEIDLGLEDVGIVTVSEDGMRATISLDHEEFVRSHPNTTFHSELTDEGEVQPVTLADLKARHITSTIFHAGRAPATVLVTAPQTTVISQATPDGSGVDHLRCSHADNISHDTAPRYDMLNEQREHPNAASAIIHSTGNARQVIRRVCYERDSRYLLDDDLMNDHKMADDRDAALESVDDDRSSPERHSELFWENSRRRENRRMDFSSDSDKCCKSPYEENNSTDSSVGVNMRLDSVIKDARGMDRSEPVDDNVPPLRTYPPKRSYHHDGHGGASGKPKTEGRFADNSEGKRRASNRGVVKRGCHCCNGTPTPPKSKKPRQRKPTMDFN